MQRTMFDGKSGFAHHFCEGYAGRSMAKPGAELNSTRGDEDFISIVYTMHARILSLCMYVHAVYHSTTMHTILLFYIRSIV
jgi:hypothetical protein